MDATKREQIRDYLRTLANSHAAMMDLLEQIMSLVGEELALDPVTFWNRESSRQHVDRDPDRLILDNAMLSVRYRGKSCFLGNSLPFKLLSRLARRPNTYLSYDELLTDVWQGIRSNAAVRSVVKTLRNKLRDAGLKDLADAIDGSVRGHYSLRLDR